MTARGLLNPLYSTTTGDTQPIDNADGDQGEAAVADGEPAVADHDEIPDTEGPFAV